MNEAEKQALLNQIHDCNGYGVTDCGSLHTFAAVDAVNWMLNSWVDRKTLSKDIEKTIAVLREFQREVLK